MKRYLCAAASLILLFSACHNGLDNRREFDEDGNEIITFSVDATRGGRNNAQKIPATRTVITDYTTNGLVVNWNETDVMALYKENGEFVCNMSLQKSTEADKDNASTTFSTATFSGRNKGEFSTGDAFSLVYPAAAKISNTENCILMDLSRQKGTTTDLANNHQYAWARVTGELESQESKMYLNDAMQNQCTDFGIGNAPIYYCNLASHDIDKHAAGDDATYDALLDNKVAVLRASFVAYNASNELVPLSVLGWKIKQITITDANNNYGTFTTKAKMNIGHGLVTAVETGNIILSDESNNNQLNVATITKEMAQTAGGNYYVGDGNAEISYGDAVYIAFPCTENSTNTKRYLNIAPHFTLLLSNDYTTKTLYAQLKTKQIREGHYYMTTALTCVSDAIVPELYVAEWIDVDIEGENTQF